MFQSVELQGLPHVRNKTPFSSKEVERLAKGKQFLVQLHKKIKRVTSLEKR